MGIVAMLGHWELEQYRQLYRNQIDRLVDTLTVRLLPTVDSVHSEVEALQAEAYRASQEWDSDGNWLDPQMDQDAVSEASLEHFDIVLDLRQGLQNMFAVSLYHLFEQQIRTFHVRVLRQRPLKFGPDVLKEWDKAFPNSVLSADQRSGLDELRLLANTVKHGDGTSAHELYAVAPHLFLADWEQDALDDPTVIVHKPDIGTPLFGQDLFVRPGDMKSPSVQRRLLGRSGRLYTSRATSVMWSVADRGYFIRLDVSFQHRCPLSP